MSSFLFGFSSCGGGEEQGISCWCLRETSNAKEVRVGEEKVGSWRGNSR